MRLLFVSIIAVLTAACAYTKIVVSIDEEGKPKTVAENLNTLRIATSAQVVTYDPTTKVVAVSQVTAADKMSEELMKSWGMLMDVATGALVGTVAASTAGVGTTPAAVAGGLLGYVKNKMTEPEVAEEGER